MAFESGRSLCKCCLCKEEYKFLKMMESDNPATHGPRDRDDLTREEEEARGPGPLANRGSGKGGSGSSDRGPGPLANRGSSGKGGSGSSDRGVQRFRCCTQCELQWRVEVQHEWHPDDPEWATERRVNFDMKKANKGEMWVAKGIHYKASVEIIDKMQDLEDTKISRQERARMKTAKCKELAEALVRVLKNGRLFTAFVNAGQRLKVSKEFEKELDTKYNEYLADPEDKEKLAALEELEEAMHEADEYKAAGGDSKRLKALDYHNELDEGFVVFDVCRRSVGYQPCAIYMPSFYWRRPCPEM